MSWGAGHAGSLFGPEHIGGTDAGVCQARVSADAPRFVEADSLFFAMRPLSALRLLEARLEADPDDYQARWRAARAALTLGILTDAGALKGSWLQLSETFAGPSLTVPDLYPPDPMYKRQMRRRLDELRR
jgi:hypothetical protein